MFVADVFYQRLTRIPEVQTLAFEKLGLGSAGNNQTPVIGTRLIPREPANHACPPIGRIRLSRMFRQSRESASHADPTNAHVRQSRRPASHTGVVTEAAATCGSRRQPHGHIRTLPLTRDVTQAGETAASHAGGSSQSRAWPPPVTRICPTELNCQPHSDGRESRGRRRQSHEAVGTASHAGTRRQSRGRGATAVANHAEAAVTRRASRQSRG